MDCDDVMLAMAARDQRTLTGLEETQYRRHLAECDACRALTTEGREDWRWVARLPDDAFEDPDAIVLPVVDPIVFDAQREIASGGMGRITRANDRRLGREVAIKEVLDPDLRARFEREAMITARLQHPAIIPIYEAGVWPDGSAFYTMRLVDGGTLAASIENTTTMAERVALLPHVVAVTEALAYAHSRRIIHRDLKPGNVLVGAFGETVVIDWGLAKEIDQASDERGQLSPSLVPSSPHLTSAGAVLGTPGFMSPEQASGDELDARADVYALGSILYNVLAGVAPYYDQHAGDTPDLLVELVRLKPPTPLSELAPDVPADLRAIVERAMGPMATRYPSAKEMAEELRRFQTGKLIAARDYRLRDLMARWIRRHRAAVVVSLVAFVALTAGAVVAVVNITRSRASEQAQRVAAESSLTTALEEQARTEILGGDRERGLVYASEAYRRGRDTPALRYLLAVATRDLDLAGSTIAPPQLTTPCGTDPGCSSAEVETLGFAADGQLVLVETTGRLSTWRDGRRTSSTALDREFSSAQLDPAVEHAAIGGEHWLEMWDIQHGTRQWRVDDESLSSTRLWFAPTGKQLVALTQDGGIHGAPVFDAASGAVVATIDMGAQRIVEVAYSPDGRLVAACGVDGSVRLWETTRFTEVATLRSGRPLRGHGPAQHVLAFAGPDRIVVDDELWQIDTASVLRVLVAPTNVAIAATDSGDLIATADGQTVRLWNRDGERLAESKAAVSHLVFAPGGVLVGAGDDPQVDIWELPSLDLRQSIVAGSTELVVVDRTGSRIATAGETGQHVHEWRMPVGHRVTHVPAVAAAFVAGGRWIESTPAGTTIRRQDSGAAVGHLELGAGLPERLEVSRDGRRILLHEGDHPRVLDLSTGAAAVQLAGGWSSTLSGDGRYVLDLAQVGDKLEDVVRVFDATAGSTVLELKLPKQRTMPNGDISSDGQRIAVGSGRHVKLWQVATGVPLLTVEVVGPRQEYQPRFDPTGRTFVVTGTESRLAIVYEVATGRELSRFEDSAPISSASFDQSGRFLLTRNENHVVHLWDTPRQLMLASVAGVSDAYAFSADGGRFATGDDGGAVRLWDTATGRQLGSFHEHHEAITGVSFNEAGDRLLVISKDQHASLWDVHLERRGPAKIAALAENAGWTLVGGLLVAKQPR